MPTDAEILALAKAFFVEHVRPCAAAIDASPDELRRALVGLCERNLMALRRPEAFGGPAVRERTFREFQEMSARYSGTLSFLITQHQSAVSMLAKSANEDLKRRYLPEMGDGRKLLGIGFSQLRRPSPPILQAEPCSDGYTLTGTVPWVTGWTFYPEYVVGATLPDGRAVFGIAPLTRMPDKVRITEPMKLAAMEAALTVSVDLTGWTLPESDVLFVQPANWAKTNDQINIVLQGYFALGCARAGLDVVQENVERRSSHTIRVALEALEAELNACRDKAYEIQNIGGDLTTDEKLHVRAWAIDLAVRCAHAAIASSGGSANSLQHPAQRIYREALVYTVSAQTPEIMAATLERLVRQMP
jgi:alkylation response protein AidB-like acyl-CoA dehydrogenase